MGSCLSQDKVNPEDSEREDSAGKKSFKGPVEGRSCTDVAWIVLLALFSIGFFALLGHSIKHGDIHRVINGYDNCGNICGMVTAPESDPNFPCKGADFTNKRFLLIKEAGRAILNPANVHKECVSDCNYPEGYRQFLNRCIPEKSAEVVNSFFSRTGFSDFFHEVSEDLHHCWKELLYLSLIALVASLVILFLFRFVAGMVVWIVLLATIFFCIAATIYSWVVYSQKTSEKNESEVGKRVLSSYLAYAVVTTTVTVIVVLIVVAMRKRISLVVQLFEEAGKAISAMPLLLFEPILTFVAIGVIISLWMYFSIWIESSGFLAIKNNNYYYKKDPTMKVTRWYNFFGMLWFVQFSIGCQHMIIAGAVATWFFTRNKDDVKSPISKATNNLLRYHLGSVAFGSFVITLVQFLRAVLAYVQKTLQNPQNDVTKCFFKVCHCCLYCFEKVLAYITRNAYIEIAIYGRNFCQGGQQAFKLLTSNALRVAAINSLGDFILFLGKVIVVSITVFSAMIMLESKEGVLHLWVPVMLAGIFAYFIAHCFMTVYEMVIDTIFLCFCEDCEINDGISKPYFMSKGLMEFVENSKKTLAVGDG